MRRALLINVLAIPCFGHAATAQVADSLRGSDIRVVQNGVTRNLGKYAGLTADSVFFLPRGGRDVQAIPRQEIEMLSLRRTSRGRNMMRFGLLGGVGVAALSYAVRAKSYHREQTHKENVGGCSEFFGCWYYDINVCDKYCGEKTPGKAATDGALDGFVLGVAFGLVWPGRWKTIHFR